MGNETLCKCPKSHLIVFKTHFRTLPDLIQVHVAVKAVEVRVLSRAHPKTPSDALNSDQRAFFF